MKNRQVNNLAYWAGIAFIVFCVGASILTVSGCEHGSLIPIDPEFDVCMVEGVEDCCPPPEVIIETETVVETEVVTETVYLCKQKRLVCDKTGTHKHWFGCGHCHYEFDWIRCEDL